MTRYPDLTGWQRDQARAERCLENMRATGKPTGAGGRLCTEVDRLADRAIKLFRRACLTAPPEQHVTFYLAAIEIAGKLGDERQVKSLIREAFAKRLPFSDDNRESLLADWEDAGGSDKSFPGRQDRPIPSGPASWSHRKPQSGQLEMFTAKEETR